jgi:hypothetical protein
VGHVALERLAGRVRRVLSPYLVDQVLGRHDPIRVEKEARQHRPLLWPTGGNLPAIDRNLEWAEHPELHGATVRPIAHVENPDSVHHVAATLDRAG